MSDEPLLYNVANGVACITLNNVMRRNAMSLEMGQRFDAALIEAATDRTIRAIVVTGNGSAFCSGGDTARLATVVDGGYAAAGGATTTQPDDAFAVLPDVPPAYRSRYTFAMAIPKPVIAAVNGPAVGAGFALALHCDIRFAAPGAAFLAGFGRIGAAPEVGIAWTLPTIVGAGIAREMLMSGRRVEADEALRIGLVNRLLTAETLVAETLDYARTLADRIAPLSIRSLKRQMRDGPGRTFEAAFASAAIDAAEARASQDMREGLAAAREKRPARFTGE